MIGIDFNDMKTDKSIRLLNDEGFRLCTEVSKIHESKLQR